MNRFLLEKVGYLLSDELLDKSFWVEALVYASHLMKCLSSTTIGGKTPLDIWSGKTIICCGYLDIQPTLESKMTNWIREKRSLCF